MKIVTWNVNSIRARLENVMEWLKEANPDILLLQEIKCEEKDFPKGPLEDLGYNIAIAGQKTYNGVAILAKSPLEDVVQGLPTFEEDESSRYIEAVVGTVRVASVYVPNGMAVGSDKYEYKLKFLEKLREHLASLLLYEEAAIIGGDYNIAPEKEDVNQPEVWEGNILFSPAERRSFQSLLHLGYYDAIRLHHSGIGPFSWWDYRNGGWQKDNGLRIDHLLLSPLAVDRVQASGVDTAPRAKEKASDHAPVWCILKIKERFMRLTTEQVAHVAKLARIHVKPEELAALGDELSGIFHWIDQLETVDVRGVENYTDCQPQPLPERDDIVNDGNNVEAILANAPEKAHNMFAVPKVVE